MRKAIFGLIAVVAPMTTLAQEHIREYDRFKDTTHYQVNLDLSELGRTTPGIDLDISTDVQGNAPASEKDNFSVNMTVTYNMTASRGCLGSGVDILADDVPMSLETAMPPFFRGSFAISTYTRTLTFGEAAAFANSDSVEIRVCSVVYQLDMDQRSKLATFMESIQQTE